MPSPTGLSTSVGARLLRGCGVLLVGAGWMGLTVTTPADGAGVRPGDSVSAAPFVATMEPDAPARALPRLVDATAPLTGPEARALHAALASADAWLASHPPAHDRSADEQAQAELPPPTAQTERTRGIEAGTQTLELASALTTAALDAPAEQSRRLMQAAATLDDAARATLSALKAPIPTDSGVKGALASANKVGAGATHDPSDVLAPALAGARCTGDAAVPVSSPAAPSASSSGSTPAPTSAAQPTAVQGLATFPAADVALGEDRANLFHAVAASAGRLAYATDVVSDRTKSEALGKRGDELNVLARQLQAAQPAGCAPVITTTAGATQEIVKGGTTTLVAARLAMADQLRDAAASLTGEARLTLMTLWWAERSR